MLPKCGLQYMKVSYVHPGMFKKLKSPLLCIKLTLVGRPTLKSILYNYKTDRTSLK